MGADIPGDIAGQRTSVILKKKISLNFCGIPGEFLMKSLEELHDTSDWIIGRIFCTTP